MSAPAPAARKDFTPPANLSGRKRADASFVIWGLVATVLGLGVLTLLVADLAGDAAPRLFAQGGGLGQFLSSFPATDPAKAGVLPALVGSLLVILATALIAIPLGVAAGVYLEEYAPKNRLTDALELTINNLAGVPSIIYGLLGLGLFIYAFAMGQTILTAGLTLALLILPVIIVASREAVRAVPRGVREAALAVGATRWQATSHHVLPYATPGIVTGVIIGLSRALGETAPLIMIGVPTFIAFLPFNVPGEPRSYTVGAMNESGLIQDFSAKETVILPAGGEVAMLDGQVMQAGPGVAVEAPAGSFVQTEYSFLEAVSTWLPWTWDGQGWLNQSFTAMPMQMFNWTQRPEEAFQQNAAAAGIVLLVITLVLNGAAIWLRYRMRKNIRW